MGCEMSINLSFCKKVTDSKSVYLEDLCEFTRGSEFLLDLLNITPDVDEAYFTLDKASFETLLDSVSLMCPDYASYEQYVYNSLVSAFNKVDWEQESITVLFWR